MGRGFWGTLSGERGIGATGAREEGDRRMWAGLRELGGELTVICPQPTRTPPPPSPTPGPHNLAPGLDLLSSAPIASRLISSMTHGGMDHHHPCFRDEDTESQRG